jgi:lysophospholipase L1-like esterase
MLKTRTIAAACSIGLLLTLSACQKAPPKRELNSNNKNEVAFFFNSRPVPTNAYRILFVGDSLTCHGPLEGVWDKFNGMAATSYTNDFVHLFATRVQMDLGSQRPVEIFLVCAGPLKAMHSQILNQPGLKPDLIVFQGGENDEYNEAFKKEYRQLLSSVKNNDRLPKAIVLGDWWTAEKSEFDRSVAVENGFAFVDINLIFKKPGCSGDGGPYAHKGVAAHPNDEGMSEIAKAMGAVFEREILPALKAR